MSEPWEVRQPECTTEMQIFLRDVAAADVEDYVNKLSKAGWCEILYDRHNSDDDSFKEPVYTVSAHRVVCRCKV